jgi:outer membrane protein assembly factor BamB
LPSLTDYTAGVTVYVGSINPTGVSGTGVTIGQFMTGINIKTGQVMWNVTTLKKGDGSESFFSTADCETDNGVFIARGMEGEIMAWDLYSGQLKWSTKLPYPWGEFGPYQVATGYGLYITGTYNGVFGINETNGNIEWNFHAYTPYQFETPYQTGIGSAEYAFHVGVLIADKKVYISAAEHTPSEPLTRGLKLYCLNVLTGEQLWNVSGSQVDQSRAFTGAIAEGYLVFGSEYDAVMYVFGKGKSATTVTAPDTVIPKGNGVVIKGTVLDLSPAQPNTPCVSKESMTTQIEYLNMQYPIDGVGHNIQMTGVPVTLTAIDSNNNPTNIGTVTTSAYYGTFEMAWTPPAEGTYKIIASFVGDDSYGSSGAATAVSVGPAIATPATPEIPTPVDNTMLLYGILVLVVIAILIGLVALLRKR